MRARIFPPRTVKSLVYWALIPVVICELVLSPFWLARVYMDHGWLPAAQLCITGLLLPLSLAVLGITIVWRSGIRQVLTALAVLVASVVLLLFLDYSVWGISSGRFWAPDYGTLLIMRIAGEVAFSIALVPALLALVVRYIIEHAHRNA